MRDALLRALPAVPRAAEAVRDGLRGDVEHGVALVARTQRPEGPAQEHELLRGVGRPDWLRLLLLACGGAEGGCHKR